jgi:hypothetical protein
VTGQEDTGRTLTRINMEPKLNMGPKLILNAASCIAVLGLVLATAVISSCSTGGQSSPSAVADAPDPLVGQSAERHLPMRTVERSLPRQP